MKMQMQFEMMSNGILERIDEMSKKIEGLEAHVNELSSEVIDFIFGIEVAQNFIRSKLSTPIILLNNQRFLLRKREKLKIRRSNTAVSACGDGIIYHYCDCFFDRQFDYHNRILICSVK
jgi:hypothetical protein